MRGKLSAGIAVLTVILAFPSFASALTRHVTPHPGGGATCAAESPCALTIAIADSGLGDEIVVAPGDYTLEEPVALAPGVTLRGAAGAPRPVLHGNAGGALVTASAANTLRHLTIRQDGPGSAVQAGGEATLDGLFLHAAGSEATAVRLGAGSLSNSVAWASADTGTAVQVFAPAGAGLHNVTAWASGTHGAGILLDQLTQAAATNTIARAPSTPPGSGGDVVGGGPLAATLVASGSNFSTTDGPVNAAGPGNSSAPPSLANADAGDFHQLRGSSTIDAGVPNTASPAADFDGDARVLGAAPDVGADEFVPHAPGAVTGAATDISRAGATLTGSVDANGLPTTYRFEYGATPLYGASTPAQDAGAGADAVPVSQALTGLAPGSIVHYRLVASNADGETAGLDRVLIVLGAPPGGGDLPRFTELSLPTSAVVGRPVVLEVGGRDRDAPLNSVVVDFGDGESFFAESACRLRPPDPAFRRNRTRTFTLPYTFSRPGVHTVQVTLGSGDCGRGGQTATQSIAIEVLPAGRRLARVRASETPTTAGASCRNADVVPTRANRRKVQRATICVLNYVRRQHGMTRFRMNRKLRRAGALHNRYMLRGRFFAHQGPGEPSLRERIRSVGYRGGAGENLGAGAGVPYATARGMVDGWMNSPVHRANVLEVRYRTVGVAVAARKPYDPAVPGATYTAEFGTTRR